HFDSTRARSSAGNRFGWAFLLSSALWLALAAGLAQAAASMDFNGDGKSDLLWHNGGSGQNAIWLMNGFTLSDGQFILTVPDASWVIAGTGDFNGDGRSDILWRNRNTGQNAIWLMNGFTVADGQFISSNSDTSWFVAAVGDFDGDGKSD